MSTNKNVPLRASQRKAQMQGNIKKQSKYRTMSLLAFIAVIWLLDMTVLNSHLRVTKAITIGAVLNWFTQVLFIWFVFRFTGAKSKRNIVNQLYVGQIIKWIITILGFVVIFSTIKNLPAGYVLLGYISMQLIHFICLWRIK